MQDWFDEYAESHQHPFNKFMHWLCVPSIFFSVFGLLASIPHDFLAAAFPASIEPFIHFGTVFMVFGLIFYLRISFPMFLGMFLVAGLTIWGVAKVEASFTMPLWQISLIIFLVAWIGQFIGHHVEGKKPSFFKDLQFLMIGPAWLLGFIYRSVGLKY